MLNGSLTLVVLSSAAEVRGLLNLLLRGHGYDWYLQRCWQWVLLAERRVFVDRLVEPRIAGLISGRSGIKKMKSDVMYIRRIGKQSMH